MKKTLLLAAVAAQMLLMASCKNKNNGGTEAATTATAAAAPLSKLTFTSKEFKAEKNSQTCNLKVDIAQGDSPQAKFINEFIFNRFNAGEIAEKGNFNYQKIADDFVNTAVAMQEEEPGGDWSRDATAKIEYNNGNIICLSYAGWEYAGGVRGEGWWDAFFMDMAAMKELKNSDLIADEMGLRKLITPLLEKQLANYVGDESTDKDYFKENGIYQLCSDWYISEKGNAVFVYTYEELFGEGSGEVQGVDIELPLAQVQPFLKLKL